MTDRLHCDAFHYTDGACCSQSEPCTLHKRVVHITPAVVQPVRPLWQAALVLIFTAIVALGLVTLERAEERKARENQESIAWFKLDRSIGR